MISSSLCHLEPSQVLARGAGESRSARRTQNGRIGPLNPAGAGISWQDGCDLAQRCVIVCRIPQGRHEFRAGARGIVHREDPAVNEGVVTWEGRPMRDV
jgi:hypothetical protein